jgi:hypothetical protein
MESWLHGGHLLKKQTTNNEKMAMFSNIFKKKWIEDSIEPYSLQTMTDYTKNLDRVFPVYNIALVTVKTKETEKNAALLSVYVKTKIFANMSALLMNVTGV